MLLTEREVLTEGYQSSRRASAIIDGLLDPLAFLFVRCKGVSSEGTAIWPLARGTLSQNIYNNALMKIFGQTAISR